MEVGGPPMAASYMGTERGSGGVTPCSASRFRFGGRRRRASCAVRDGCAAVEAHACRGQRAPCKRLVPTSVQVPADIAEPKGEPACPCDSKPVHASQPLVGCFSNRNTKDFITARVQTPKCISWHEVQEEAEAPAMGMKFANLDSKWTRHCASQKRLAMV